MIVFCFSTLTYSFWPPINRVLAVAIVAALGCNYMSRLQGKEAMLIIGLVGVLLLSLVSMEETAQNLEDWLYWAITCAFLLLLGRKDFVARLSEEMNSLRKFMFAIIVLANIVLLVSFVTRSGYVRTNMGIYFKGFAFSEHTICCGCAMLLALILYYYKGRRASITQMLLMVPASLAIMESGARTFIIALAVVWIIYYVDFVKSVSAKVMIFPVALVVVAYVFMNSGMMQKFINTSSNVYISENTMTAMSSGRLDFWKLDLEAYWDLPFFGKLLGNGFDYVYRVNQEGYNMRIWAHNDIIDLLLSAGLLGVFIYLAVFRSLYRSIFRLRYGRLGKLLLFMYILLPMLLNGLFVYQHYLYSFVLLFIYCSGQEQAFIEKEADRLRRQIRI